MEPLQPPEPTSTPEGPQPNSPPPAPLYPVPPSAPGAFPTEQTPFTTGASTPIPGYPPTISGFPPTAPGTHYPPLGYPPSAPFYPGMPGYPPQTLPPTASPFPPSGQPPFGGYPTAPFGYPPPTGPQRPASQAARKPVRGPQVAIVVSALVIFTLVGVLIVTTTLQNRAEVAAHATATAQTQNDQATQVAFAATATRSAINAEDTQVAFAATATMQTLEQGYSTSSPGCAKDDSMWQTSSNTTITCPASGGMRMADTSSQYLAEDDYLGEMGYFPRNYQMNVTMQFNNATGQQGAGCLLRYSLGTGQPGIGFFIFPNNFWFTTTYASNGTGSIVSSGSYTTDSTNILTAKANGTTITFIVNGVTIASVADRNVGQNPKVSLSIQSNVGSVLFTDFSLKPM
jgi:hypothetical protein